MNRDELIDAASQAMHDLFDRPGKATNREYAAAVVDAVDSLIRTKVEALRDEAKSDDDFDHGWAGACREVLALFDGSSE